MLHDNSCFTIDRSPINRKEFLVRTACAIVGTFAIPNNLAAEPGRPYLYHYAVALSRSHERSQAIARKELGKARFEILSAPAAWEHVAVNADTIIVVANVPLSSGKTHVHVIATSNTDASAKKWSVQIMEAIKNSKMTLID